MTISGTSTKSSFWCNALTIGLLLFAVAHFLERGPLDWRGNFALHDFNMFYSASSVWLDGGNAYDRTTLFPAWLARGGRTEVLFSEFWTSVLPPGALLVISPISLVPLPAALVLWIGVLLGFVALMLWSVISIVDLHGAKARLFVALGLACGPVQWLLALGQGGLPVIALLLFGIERAHRRKDIVAGIVMGLGACIKPQLVFPVLLYYVFYRRWRVVMPALICCGLLTGIGALRLQMNYPGWHSQWLANIAATSAPGMQDDLVGPYRDQMIHLPVWLSTFISDPHTVKALSWAVCLTLAAAFVVALAQLREDYRREILVLSALVALMLLPVYHKGYDAAVLLLPLGWALANIGGSERRYAWTVLAGLSVFLMPFEFLREVMARTDKLNALTGTALWRTIIRPHDALATLVVSLLLLGTLWATMRRSAPVSTPALAGGKPIGGISRAV